jgi:two-component system response regulator MtrA
MSDPTATPAIPQARVLVVDDEASVCLALARSLTLLGYTADAATSGYQALAMLGRAPYDAMVLDIRMPGMDGVEVMQRVCHMYPGLSVIFLTGHATLESAIAAVRSCVADYLLKPASVHDIAAAIARALEQRAQEGPPRVNSPGDFLRVGPVILDRERHLAIVAEADGTEDLKAELTVSESALLAHLMQHPHTVFSCCELARDVLGYEVSKEEAQKIVRPHICRLRKKVELDPDHPRLIRNVAGEGYSFTP